MCFPICGRTEARDKGAKALPACSPYFSPGILFGSMVTWRAGSMFMAYSPSPFRMPCTKWCLSMSVASSAPCSNSVNVGPSCTSCATRAVRTCTAHPKDHALQTARPICEPPQGRERATLWRRNSSRTARRDCTSISVSPLNAISRARISRRKAASAGRIFVNMSCPSPSAAEQRLVLMK